jgi:OOP family OmpA-OmpF porin
MRTRTLLGILPLAFALASTSALAQDDQRGFYIGLSVGQSKVEIEDSFLPTPGGVTASSVSKDETDTGFKLYGGYRIHRNFALEGGWVDLGSFKATRNVTAPAVGSLSAEIESSGPYIDALGILPLQQFNLFAKLGAMYATTKTTLSRTGAVVFVPGANTTPEESEVEFKFGLGASYSFTRNLAIRAEYERFFDVGSDETGEGNVDLISIGITFRF